MDSYKELYLHMVHETDKAMRILEEAHKACEEALLNQNEPELYIISKEMRTHETTSEL